VETGKTGSAESADNAALIFDAWARYYGILTGRKGGYRRKLKVYRTVASVMAPNTTYQVVDGVSLDEFTPVMEGQVLLQNPNGDKVVAPCSGQVIWGPSDRTLTDVDVASEIWYIVQAA
jgi:hypothetical protein